MSENMKTPNGTTKHKNAALDINPETKIAALLKNYPDLEDVLIKLSPTFGKLRNPVLRRTVARITSLRQAAQIADIELGSLINELRRSTGIAELQVENESKSEVEKPTWITEERIVLTFDAREMIESGGHPLNKVLEDIRDLKGYEIYLLITPFLPAPLIEMVANKGYETWTDNHARNECKTYITKELN